MKSNKCMICGWHCGANLCSYHSFFYIWDSSLQGFRLKKRISGSRYLQGKYHKSEISLTKNIESFYGKSKIVTSFHPIWALGSKGVLYEYDIHIKDTKILIEYNGIQHYQFTKFFHKRENKFLKQQFRDKDKELLAKENGFRLIIFKYDEPSFKEYIIQKIEEQNDN